MSIDLMSAIWKTCLYDGGRLHVLLAMADIAEDDGYDIYPGLDLLAAKTRQTERGTSGCIQKLREDRVVVLLDKEELDLPPEEAFEGGRGKFAKYRIDLERLNQLQALHEAENPECGWCSARRKRMNRRNRKVEQKGLKAEAKDRKVENSCVHIEDSSNPSQESSGSDPTGTALAVLYGSTDIDLALQIFNEAARQCPKWATARGVTAQRRKNIGARLKAHGLEGWRRAVAMAAASGFLGGPIPQYGEHRGWRLTIKWFANEENFQKVIEGAYPEGKGGPGHGRALTSAMEGIMIGINSR